MNMTKMMKTMTALVLVLLMTGSLAVTTFAANDGEATTQVTPRWVGIATMNVNMSFDGTAGNAVGTAIKMSRASRIEGTLRVYELVDGEWESLGEWYGSKTVGTLAVSGDFTCKSGVTYKAEWTVTAYTNNVPETETFEYSETC